MIDSTNPNLIRMDENPFITFNKITRELHCEHCTQIDTEVDSQRHVVDFAKAHSECPVNATSEQREKANKKCYEYGFRSAFGY
jgi:hypothetical protein